MSEPNSPAATRQRAQFFSQTLIGISGVLTEFLNATFMEALPENRFLDFWIEYSKLPPNPKNKPTVDRDKTIMALGISGISSGKRVGDYSDEEFARLLRKNTQSPLPKKLRKKLLDQQDLAAFVKMSEYHNQITYGMLAAACPRLKQINANTWRQMSRNVRESRNGKMAHTTVSSREAMTYQDFYSAIDLLVGYAELLETKNTSSMLEYLHSIQARAKQARTLTIQELTKAAGGMMTVQQVSGYLQQCGYDIVDNVLVGDETLILHQINFYKASMEKEQLFRNQQKELEELRKNAAPSSAEVAVQRTLLEKLLNKIPPLDRLMNCDSSPLDLRDLQELAATHHVVLTASLLKKSEGRSFITRQLRPMLERAGRDPRTAMVVEATTMLHLLQDALAYSDINHKLRDTVWQPGPMQAERQNLERRKAELQASQKAYIFVRDELHLAPTGVPDPLYTDDQALLQFMESHPYDRICVLLCGASRLVTAIDRSKLPFVLVGRVRSGSSMELCSLFPQLLPPAASNPDEPLLEGLMQDLEKLAAAEEEVQSEPEPAPVEQPVPEPVKPPKPAEPDPRPAQAIPQPTAPKVEPAAPGRNHGSSPFAADLPLRAMDPALLPYPGDLGPGQELRTEDGGTIRLEGPLMEDGEEARGGEGILFLTSCAGQVAKLYNREHLTAGRRDKLTEMLRHDPHVDGLCWPTHLLYTSDGHFVGYTMPQAPAGAMPFSKSVLKIGSPTQRETYMKDWTRKDLVQAAQSAARIMDGLHRNNILMGDVNAGNFMVDPRNSRRVYVVDTDSFQLGGFPCPVGVEEFTHPGTAARLGITGGLEFGTFLRTEEEEDYVFSILVFEILMLGQNPFVTKSKMTFREAMAKKNFPYALKGTDYEVPDGDNWMIWKNLPSAVTDAFIDTFSEWKSTPARQWVSLMGRYLNSIQQWGFSDELTPQKYHEFHPENPTYVDLVCPLCHTEFNLHKNRVQKLKAGRQPLLCRRCQATYEMRARMVLKGEGRCRKCGRSYDLTVADAIRIQAGMLEPVCQDCLNTTVSCECCGKSMVVKRDRLDQLRSEGKGIYCTDCWKKESALCQDCGKQLPETYHWMLEASRKRNGGRTLCNDCAKMTTTRCDSCGSTVRIDRRQLDYLRKNNKSVHCSSCNQQVSAACHRCGQRFQMPRWRKISIDRRGGGYLCENCRSRR